ncbi:MAG: hypothetical protein JO154_24285 [Chitinophaga sp.]|uniref:DUF5723 family protein n=1 Tax=Chitinophaga sp. TaxID=1869181 RepID=UPI0025C01ED1|nr:DUF5723 family protein [Chitinophaga sp.]MBV8255735.1 hypothetical protein [Chitinophaga sp.]
MKRISTLLFLVCSAVAVKSQDLPGFHSSNYAGIYSVYGNPANIANSRYNWDVNIIGVNASVGNNQVKYKLSNIGTAFGSDTLKSQLFGQNSGTVKALVNAQVYVPSFMFKVKKFTFAFTSRVRVMANVSNLDGKLADKVSRDFTNNDPDLPYTIASNDKMRVSVNGWAEYNVSVAREIIQVGPHYLKGGVTLKYLSGVGNGSLQIDNLKGTIIADQAKQDAALTNATGTIGTNFAGINFSGDNNDNIQFIGRGVGFELGAVYEYRPGGGNDYKFRLGLSLTDIGSIKYDRDITRSGTFAINIPAGQNFYLSNLDGVGIDNYKSTLNKYPQYFTADRQNDKSTYNVSLPGRMQLDGDYHIKDKFFVNGNVQFSLTSLKSKAFNSQYFGGFSVTPRYDGRIFGFFLPLSYNTLTKFNAGASLRIGPLFLGSGSLLTAMGGAHQADFFVGVRFGRLSHK